MGLELGMFGAFICKNSRLKFQRMIRSVVGATCVHEIVNEWNQSVRWVVVKTWVENCVAPTFFLNLIWLPALRWCTTVLSKDARLRADRKVVRSKNNQQQHKPRILKLPDEVASIFGSWSSSLAFVCHIPLCLAVQCWTELWHSTTLCSTAKNLKHFLYQWHPNRNECSLLLTVRGDSRSLSYCSPIAMPWLRFIVQNYGSFCRMTLTAKESRSWFSINHFVMLSSGDFQSPLKPGPADLTRPQMFHFADWNNLMPSNFRIVRLVSLHCLYTSEIEVFIQEVRRRERVEGEWKTQGVKPFSWRTYCCVSERCNCLNKIDIIAAQLCWATQYSSSETIWKKDNHNEFLRWFCAECFQTCTNVSNSELPI